MTIDLEDDLRREFDAARPPSALTFSPDSVLRQGRRTIRRNRIIAVGSAAVAVGLIAVGSTLMTRPHDSAAPQPATTHTATTGNFSGQLGWPGGTFQVDFRLDAGVPSKIRYNVLTPDGKTHALTDRTKPGLSGPTPDAYWGSGTVDGHPVAIGLVPRTGKITVTFTNGIASFDAMTDVDGAGYSMFSVAYPVTAGPVDLASIRWSGLTGIVDGVEGDHRLTGRVLDLGGGVSLEVVLRPGIGGRTTVFGQSRIQVSGNGASTDLTAASTDQRGVAVVTGHRMLLRKANDRNMFIDGAPVAAGILPPGASDIGVELTTNEAATGLAVSRRLPDGRVIFALKADFGASSALSAGPSHVDPSKDSIKAITWTNADGTQSRKAVTQKPL